MKMKMKMGKIMNQIIVLVVMMGFTSLCLAQRNLSAEDFDKNVQNLNKAVDKLAYEKKLVDSGQTGYLDPETNQVVHVNKETVAARKAQLRHDLEVAKAQGSTLDKQETRNAYRDSDLDNPPKLRPGLDRYSKHIGPLMNKLSVLGLVGIGTILTGGAYVPDALAAASEIDLNSKSAKPPVLNVGTKGTFSGADLKYNSGSK